MKHLAAYLLLGLGGNASPSAADVKAVLESVGIEADSDRLEKLISELEGKDINEVRHRLPRDWIGGLYSLLTCCDAAHR
jgi:ribosomal protein L12E/L44/L45/RPP1/RPP2